MADLKRNHPGRTIELSGGIMTDSPAVLRDVEDLENLLPPMGGGKGLEPRDGVEHILTLSTADTEGGVIFEVTLDDVARTKLIVIMDAVTGVIEHITDHTDQEGRKSIAPLGGGTLPITPAPDPVIYVNTLYFQNATLTAAAGIILTVTVLGTYVGGTATVNVDLITAENGVDVVEETWSVTANILVSDTFNITIPVGARVGRTFDVYLNNPVAVDTYLKNPTRCRVTIINPELRPMAFRIPPFPADYSTTATSTTIDMLMLNTVTYATTEVTLNCTGGWHVLQDSTRVDHGRQPVAQTDNYMAVLTRTYDPIANKTSYFINCFKRSDISAGNYNPSYVFSTGLREPDAIIGDGADKFVVLGIAKSGGVDLSKLWVVDPVAKTGTLKLENFLPEFNMSSWSMDQTVMAKDGSIFFRTSSTPSGGPVDTGYVYFKTNGTSARPVGNNVAYTACKNALRNVYGSITGQLAYYDYTSIIGTGIDPSDLNTSTWPRSLSSDGSKVIFFGDPNSGVGRSIQVYSDINGSPVSVLTKNFAAYNTGGYPYAYFVDNTDAKIATTYDWGGIQEFSICDVATGNIDTLIDVKTVFPKGADYMVALVVDPLGSLPRMCLPAWVAT